MHQTGSSRIILKTMQFTDISGQAWQVECMGCAIADSTVTPPAGGIIAANDSCYLHQDPEVPLEGFLVIGTNRHVRSIMDLRRDEYDDLPSLCRYGRQLMDLTPEIRSVTLIQEERSSHFHLWLFPWYGWMIEEYGDTNTREKTSPDTECPPRFLWKFLNSE